MRPFVDVVIPVHSAERPIERAVESATHGTGAEVRVTVVCHGLARSEIARRVADARVRVVQHDDGVASPAGPMNAGFALADAVYVSRLDSDDWFEPGALAAWMAVAQSTNADAVIAPIRWGEAPPHYAPLTRPFTHAKLDPVRDRVAYRTAPFGLLRRQTLTRLDARFTEGLVVGEDLEIGLKLWFLSHRVDLAVHAPSYVVGDDAMDRTTEVRRPLEHELAASQRVIQQEWLQRLSRGARRAIAIKIVRIHVLGALRARPTANLWADADIVYLGSLLDDLEKLAPGLLAVFTRAETQLISLLRDSPTQQQCETAISRFGSARGLDTLLTRNLLSNGDRESTLRRYLRYRLPR